MKVIRSDLRSVSTLSTLEMVSGDPLWSPSLHSSHRVDRDEKTGFSEAQRLSNHAHLLIGGRGIRCLSH